MLAVGVALLVLSGIRAKDPFTWLLEVAPALIAAPILIATYPRFAFTNLVYALILVHASILMLGGHYTYAEVPLGFWMEKAFHFSRNNYDRIGHFAQGFVPALVAREVVSRRGVIRSPGWVFVFATSVCGSVAALYEIVEWLTAVSTSGGATAFLGTQGDPWDTQEDMLMCFVGAVTSQVALGRIHDGAMRRLG